MTALSRDKMMHPGTWIELNASILLGELAMVTHISVLAAIGTVPYIFCAEASKRWRKRVRPSGYLTRIWSEPFGLDQRGASN